MRAALAIAGATILALSACGGSDDPNLIRIRSTGSGPDEFSVVPQKPLVMPPSLSSLPAPAPGGVNRTEPNPRADAIAALGGNANAGRAGDTALLAATGRYGTETGIRGELATQDQDFRANNRGRLLNRVFSNTTYYQAYGDELLNPQSEAQRWQGQGLRTPTAPRAAD